MADKLKQGDGDIAGLPPSGDKELDFDRLEKLLESDRTPGAGRAGRGTLGAERGQRSRDEADYDMLSEALGEGRPKKVVVRVSDDGLQATIDEVYPGVTCDDAMAALQKQGIRFGVDEAAIGKVVRWTARTGQTQRDMVVARGVPPAVEAGRIDYRVPLARTSAGETYTPGFQKLKSLIEEKRASELEAAEVSVKAVRPGDPLLARIPPRGTPGRDVFGREISLDSLEAAMPEVGTYAEALEDGRTCASKIYGYAGIIKEVVEVLPPLWISPDNMEAYFLLLPQVGQKQAPEPEDIRKLLALYFVDYGIDEEGIALACKQAREGGPTRLVLVAQGKAGQPGKDAEVRMAFDTSKTSPLPHVRQMLDTRRFEDFEQGRDLLAQAVSPGQAIAMRQPSTEGSFGRDIFGEEMPVAAGQDRGLVGSEHVEVSENGQVCVSKIYGYAGLINGVVQVLSPVWISPDNMEAYFLDLPQVGEAQRPGSEDVRELLKRAGVTYGIDDARIAALCDGGAEALCVRIAEGRRPVPGLDAEVSFALDVEQKPGEILEDGSIDFKRLNLSPMVDPDQFLAEKKPATKGVAGKDLRGQPVKAPDGIDLTASAGNNVRAERDGDNVRLYSKIRGGVGVRKLQGRGSKTEITLSVNPSFSTTRDVDYSTGNIDFPGDVYVPGSVRSGFSVRSGGSVAVGGNVEEKTSIFAQGDVVVARGIVGPKSEITAGGCIRLKFIQNASVCAKGDVDVGSHLFNGSVKSGGVVSVSGRGSRASKALVGGFIWATKGIVARSVGSAYANRTRLVAGVDQEQFKRLTYTQKTLDLCNTHISRLLKTLGLTAPDAAQIERILRAVRPGKQRDFVVGCVKRLGELLGAKQKLESAAEDLEAQMKQVAEEAVVEVRVQVFSGVDVRIGTEQMRVEEEARSVRFQLVEEDGVRSLRQTSLR